jgi:DNA ligase (NAD+)
MSVMGVGEAFLEDAVSHLGVTCISDLYDLTTDRIPPLRGYGEVSAKAIVSAIQGTKAEWHKFIRGLGFPGVGDKTARTLAEHFPTFLDFWFASSDDLEGVEGVGSITASAIDQYRPVIAGDVAKLLLRVALLPVFAAGEGPLKGEVIAFTGSSKVKDRKEWQEYVVSLGAKAASSFTKAATLLVVGDSDYNLEKPSSKLKAALSAIEKGQKARILTESAFAAEMGGKVKDCGSLVKMGKCFAFCLHQSSPPYKSISMRIGN